MQACLNRARSVRKMAMACSAGAAFIAVAAMIPAAASAAPYLTVDFQPPNSVGSLPSAPAASYSAAPAGSIQVVGSTSTPADPFGGAGNQSLWMQSGSGSSSTSAQIDWDLPGGSVTSGTVSVDYFLNTGNYAEIRLGEPGMFSSGSHIGPFIALSNNQVQIVSSPSHTLDNVATAGVKHTITVTFNATAHTFTGTVDGQPMKSGTTTVFSFYSGLSGIQTVGVDVGYSTASKQAFFDNISATPVPEPATLSLLGLGAMSLLGRRRRR